MIDSKFEQDDTTGKFLITGKLTLAAKPVTVRLPIDIDEAVRKMSDRTEFLREAITLAVRRRQENRRALVKQLKSYLAGDGNLWGRMASSHSEAQGLNPSFISLAENLKEKGITADTVEDYINSLPTNLDLLISPDYT